MPSLLYANNSAPFWDFVASLEQQGSQHPFFSPNHHPGEGQDHDQSSDREEHHGPPAFGPWGWGQFFGGGSGMPHRGPPQQRNDEANDEVNEKDKEKDEHMDNEKSGPHEKCDNGEGPSGHLSSDNEGHGHGRARHGRCHGRRGRCGPGGPGGRGGFGGPCGRREFGPHHGPPHRGGPWGRARWGPWGRGGFGGGFDPTALAAHFWTHFNDNNATNKKDEDQDHSPDADVFDTDTAFVIHVSVPGAKKEDIGVNWDAEKSELSVAGVIYRPGDEEFLKTLAMDERKIGAFERKIRLGKMLP